MRGPRHVQSCLAAAVRAALTFGPVACEDASGGNKPGPAHQKHFQQVRPHPHMLFSSTHSEKNNSQRKLFTMYVALTLQRLNVGPNGNWTCTEMQPSFFYLLLLNRDAFTDSRWKRRFGYVWVTLTRRASLYILLNVRWMFLTEFIVVEEVTFPYLNWFIYFWCCLLVIYMVHVVLM